MNNVIRDREIKELKKLEGKYSIALIAITAIAMIINSLFLFKKEFGDVYFLYLIIEYGLYCIFQKVLESNFKNLY